MAEGGGVVNSLALPPLPAVVPPPPGRDVITLLAALSSTGTDHEQHQVALRVRDAALTTSNDSYGNLCRELARTLCAQSPATLSPEAHGAWAAALSGAQESGANGSPAPTSPEVALARWLHLRQMACFVLKNALVSPPPAPTNDAANGGQPQSIRMRLLPDSATEIRSALMRAIVDGNQGVRKVASSTISASCVRREPLDSDGTPDISQLPAEEPPLPLRQWQDLTPFLVRCIEAGVGVIEPTPQTPAETAAGVPLSEHAQRYGAAEGALLTLRKLLEDAPTQFEKDASGPAFDAVVPLLLRTVQSPDSRQKKEGLQCLNSLVKTMPGALVALINEYLAALSGLASHENYEVRKLVCQGIVSLLRHKAEYIRPHLQSVSEFMLSATADSEEEVAVVACEFWIAFATLRDGLCDAASVDFVRSLFPRLIPVLLRAMVYPPDKVAELLEQNAADEKMVAERPQDVAPVFHSSRSKRGNSASGGDGGEDDDDDDDDEDGTGGADNYDGEWTLRKCAAASLDTLALFFAAEDILGPLLPALQEGLTHTDPWVREASVLALGAVSNGCEQEMSRHMGQLHPYLLLQLTTADSLPQLKSIAAWTLGRYAMWAVEQAEDGHAETIAIMTEAIMGGVLSSNRRVQVACCSAFGVIVESAGQLMVPFLGPVFQTLVQALTMYQRRSLMILFDCLGTMADFIGEDIGENGLPEVYIPPLLLMWNGLAKQNPFDSTLFSLMESLASIALALGVNFQPYALETFDGALFIIESCMMVMGAENIEFSDEDADPIVCAADLIDGMVEGLGPSFSALVSSSKRYGEQFPNILLALASHEARGVRMSAFAILGDLARNAPDVIQAGTGKLLEVAISCVNPIHPSVCNNAVWAIGEVCSCCAKNGAAEALRPYAGDILQSLISLLMGNAVNDQGQVIGVPGLAENAACAMGRLAKVDAAFVANDLSRFLTGWCEGMGKVASPAERRDSFEGFLLAIQANPQSVEASGANGVSNVSAIVSSVISWHYPMDPPEWGEQEKFDSGKTLQPFPAHSSELAPALQSLLQQLKASLPEQKWAEITKPLPATEIRLLQEIYGV